MIEYIAKDIYEYSIPGGCITVRCENDDSAVPFSVRRVCADLSPYPVCDDDTYDDNGNLDESNADYWIEQEDYFVIEISKSALKIGNSYMVECGIKLPDNGSGEYSEWHYGSIGEWVIGFGGHEPNYHYINPEFSTEKYSDFILNIYDYGDGMEHLPKTTGYSFTLLDMDCYTVDFVLILKRLKDDDIRVDHERAIDWMMYDAVMSTFFSRLRRTDGWNTQN